LPRHANFAREFWIGQTRFVSLFTPSAAILFLQMSDERTVCVDLAESELILISQSLDSLASAKSLLAHQAAGEQRYRQARAREDGNKGQ
jgi:hypothetical protein